MSLHGPSVANKQQKLQGKGQYWIKLSLITLRPKLDILKYLSIVRKRYVPLSVETKLFYWNAIF